jgi:hypothetical protein
VAVGADERRWWDVGTDHRSSSGVDLWCCLLGRLEERESRGTGRMSAGLRAVCGLSPLPARSLISIFD